MKKRKENPLDWKNVTRLFLPAWTMWITEVKCESRDAAWRCVDHVSIFVVLPLTERENREKVKEERGREKERERQGQRDQEERGEAGQEGRCKKERESEKRWRLSPWGGLGDRSVPRVRVQAAGLPSGEFIDASVHICRLLAPGEAGDSTSRLDSLLESGVKLLGALQLTSTPRTPKRTPWTALSFPQLQRRQNSAQCRLTPQCDLTHTEM